MVLVPPPPSPSANRQRLLRLREESIQDFNQGKITKEQHEDNLMQIQENLERIDKWEKTLPMKIHRPPFPIEELPPWQIPWMEKKQKEEEEWIRNSKKGQQNGRYDAKQDNNEHDGRRKIRSSKTSIGNV